MNPHVLESFITSDGLVHTWFKSGFELVTDSTGLLASPVSFNDIAESNAFCWMEDKLHVER